METKIKPLSYYKQPHHPISNKEKQQPKLNFMPTLLLLLLPSNPDGKNRTKELGNKDCEQKKNTNGTRYEPML